MERPRLEVGIYQIVEDAMLKANRTDGTGWEWGWADWRRDWMDATPSRYAYRCLPLTIANQTGWWVKNPVGFTATWRGRTEPGTIDFRFDAGAELWQRWVNSQFGEGIVTWNTPFLFRTKPQGSRLLVLGPANYFKAHAHPLTALIESDWISMSFTMNWKIMTPGVPVRFEPGEPLFQVIPLARNACADLEGASVTYQKLSDDPEVARSYNEWSEGRSRFHEQKARGEVKPDDWQKDYFQGRDVSGREAAPEHMTKVRAPQIQYSGTAANPAGGNGHHDAPANARAKAGAPAPAVAGASREAPPAGPAGADVRRADPYANPTQQEPDEDATVATLTRHDQPAPQGNGSPAANPDAAGTTTALAIDDDWRRWVAENLLLGAAPGDLVGILTSSGFTPADSTREVELAVNSPYLQGSDLLRNRLRKRDWMLATYRKLNRLHPGSTTVERRHRLTRGEFLNGYYSTNRPVIITGMMDDWPALQKWGLDYFAETFGDREVEVSFGRNAGDNYEVEREKFLHKLRFADFVEKVRTAGVTNDFYLTANNNSANKRVLAALWDDIVQIPEYLDGRDRLGGFFWFGPAGTITPFHHDLTNNFMAQVVGRKRVKIVPSWDTPLMRNNFHCYSKVDGRVTPPAPSPVMDEPQVLECVLNPGEVLFLPIGCWHFVEGLDVSVTVSFTNFVFDNDFSSFYTTYHGV